MGLSPSQTQKDLDTRLPAGIRDHVVQAVELKFNCFFLMPVVDSFPTRLREELEAAYEEDIDEVGRAGIHCVWWAVVQFD